MLDIEILELDRTTANQLGITPPTSSSVIHAYVAGKFSSFRPSQNNELSFKSANYFREQRRELGVGLRLPALIAFGGGKTIFLATMPSVTANSARL